MTIWLRAKLVSLHSVWFHSCALWRKKEFIETIVVVTILLTCCQYRSTADKESLQFCGFLSSVSCMLVTYGLHSKNKLTTTPNQLTCCAQWSTRLRRLETDHPLWYDIAVGSFAGFTWEPTVGPFWGPSEQQVPERTGMFFCEVVWARC